MVDDFLRLLYARAGEAYSYLSGEKMVKYGEEQILSLVIEKYEGKIPFRLCDILYGEEDDEMDEE